MWVRHPHRRSASCTAIRQPFRPVLSNGPIVLVLFAAVIMAIPIVTATDDAPAGEQQQAAVSKCGPLPSNEEMMKVLKPMSDIILQCLPVFEKHSLKLSSIFIAAEELCGDFDKCVPSGIISNRDVNNPELHCFAETIKRAMPEHLEGLDFQAAVNDFYACLAPNVPLKKKGFFSVMHWYLAMTSL